VRLPEPSSVNSVVFHLKVQGLVIGSEQPSRLALVPHGDLEGPLDGLLFSLLRRRSCDLFQRRVTWRQLFPECNLRGRTGRKEREVIRLMARRITFRVRARPPACWHALKNVLF
jgi:hypothetical protein